jgi:hypothetical protein
MSMCAPGGSEDNNAGICEPMLDSVLPGVYRAWMAQQVQGWPEPVSVCAFDPATAVSEVRGRHAAALALTAPAPVLAAEAQKWMLFLRETCGARTRESAVPPPEEMPFLGIQEFVSANARDAHWMIGVGTVSGSTYRVSSEVFRVSSSYGGVGDLESTTYGVTSGVIDEGFERLVQLAVADVLVADSWACWWARPRTDLWMADEAVDAALPAGTRVALTAAGLVVEAWVRPVVQFLTGLVAVRRTDGAEVTIGYAGGNSLDDVLGTAFLRAMSTRSAVQDLLAGAVRADTSTVGALPLWFFGGTYLGVLRENAHCGAIGGLDTAGIMRNSRSETVTTAEGRALREGLDWVDVAARRYGSEPVALGLGLADRLIVRVACAGAAVYRPANTVPFAGLSCAPLSLGSSLPRVGEA